MIYSDDADFILELQGFETRVAKHKNGATGRSGLLTRESERVREACAAFYEAYSGKPPAGWAAKAADMVERLEPDESLDNAVESVDLFANRGVLGRDKKWCYKEAFVCLYNVSFQSSDVAIEDLSWFSSFPDMAEEINECVGGMYDSLGVDDVPDDWIQFIRQLIPDSTSPADFYPAFLRACDFIALQRSLPPSGGTERARLIAAYYSIPPVASESDEFVIMKVARDFSGRDVGKTLAGDRSYEEWLDLLRIAVADKSVQARFADKYDPVELERFLKVVQASASASEPSAALLWLDILPALSDQAGTPAQRGLLDNVSAVSIDAEYREFALNYLGDGSGAADFWAVWSAPIRTAVRRRLGSDSPYAVQVWDKRMGNVGDAAG